MSLISKEVYVFALVLSGYVSLDYLQTYARQSINDVNQQAKTSLRCIESLISKEAYMDFLSFWFLVMMPWFYI